MMLSIVVSRAQRLLVLNSLNVVCDQFPLNIHILVIGPHFMLLDSLDDLFFAVAFFHFEISIVSSLLEISSMLWCYFWDNTI